MPGLRAAAAPGRETNCIVSDVLVDTNILAYRFDGSEPAKQSRARDVLENSEHRIFVSTQVLLELFVVLTRKLKPSVPLAEARLVLGALTRSPVVPADGALVLRAARTADEHQLSIWDAMIVEAAVVAGCSEVWTEDLATGATLRGVRIINPLVDEPEG